MSWREITASAELTAFAIGKTVARCHFDSDMEAITWFTDGTGIRCRFVRGRVYSEYSADSDEVMWAIFTPPIGAAPPQ